jgi:hypothetical protein
LTLCHHRHPDGATPLGSAARGGRDPKEQDVIARRPCGV